MVHRRLRFLTVVVLALAVSGFVVQNAWAHDLRLTFPRHSELTPVQRLNREGVDAIRKHAYDRAEQLFYKAYLYDPADPFTLNNLGYISELQGQLDRAESFYAMASKQAVGAWIDVSTEKDLEGKPMTYALNDLKSAPMRINRMNFDAMNLLSQGRALEADTLLRHALAIDPHNSFTLNNLGVASEALGEYEAALRDYTAAAAAGSSEQVVVTPDDAWMGQPVSKMAADNARNLEARLQELSSDVERAAVLNARGVAAINQNNWEAARQDFLKAYSLNPYSAFSLNNAGYVAEREGDVESAQFFYARARQANDAGARVGLATTLAAEGGPLAAVASNNDQETENKLEEQRLERHRQKGPIQLLHPNGTPVVTSQSTPKDMLPAGDQPPMPSSPTQPQP